MPFPLKHGAGPDLYRPRIWTQGLCCAVFLALGFTSVAALQTGGQPAQSGADEAHPLEPPILADAMHLFYNGHYEEAAAATLALRASGPEDLANDELRTSALLFQLKALLEQPADTKVDDDEVLKRCTACPDLIAAFMADFHHGQTLAHSMLKANDHDDRARFFLGKLDLNYVWLQLGTLHHKTGWSEYWEARHSLDAVLKRHPNHVRARVARAWIDYIVGTRVPWVTRWLLGGGNRKHALASVRKATHMDAEFFAHIEAQFALWEMLVREGEMTEATSVAQGLARAFPDNHQIATFLAAHPGKVQPPEPPAP